MVENANFIGGLIRTSPSPQDFKKEGDDHIRLLKAVLLNSILGFSGAALVQGADAGTANSYVLNPPQKLLAYAVGTIVLMTPANMNGGASTINISSLGTRPIRRVDGSDLVNGDLVPGVPVAMAFDGVAFRLLGVTKAYIDQLILSGALPGQEDKDGLPMITDGTNATFRSNFGRAMDEAKGAPIAATPTLNLNSAAGTGNWTPITGAGVSINAITLPAGSERVLYIVSAGNTLVHGANLDLPGKANIVTQAGDRVTVRGDGAGKAVVVDYVRASGRAIVEPTGPGWTLLTPPVTPVEGVAIIDLLNVFTSVYDDYVILFDDISPSAASTFSQIGALTMQFAVAGVLDPANNCRYGSVTESSSSIGRDFVTGLVMRAFSGQPVSTTGGMVRIQNVNGRYKTLSSEGFNVALDNAGGGNAAVQMGGTYLNAQPVTGFRLRITDAAARFGATGSIKIYGIRKAV